jgi:hypothetical protein
MLIEDCKIWRWQHLLIVAPLMKLSTKVIGFTYETASGGVPASRKQSDNSREVQGTT